MKNPSEDKFEEDDGNNMEEESSDHFEKEILNKKQIALK